MSKLKAFIHSIKTIPVKKPEPKFKVGDVVINRKFKVISKVVSLRGIFENEDLTVNYEAAQYVLEDIKNEALDNYMQSKGLGSGDALRNYRENTGKSRQRYKYCAAIDGYYERIDSKAAQILYGIKDNDEVKND